MKSFHFFCFAHLKAICCRSVLYLISFSQYRSIKEWTISSFSLDRKETFYIFQRAKCPLPFETERDDLRDVHVPDS